MFNTWHRRILVKLRPTGHFKLGIVYSGALATLFDIFDCSFQLHSIASFRHKMGL